MVVCVPVTAIALSVTLAVSFTQQFQGQTVSLEDITGEKKKKIPNLFQWHFTSHILVLTSSRVPRIIIDSGLWINFKFCSLAFPGLFLQYQVVVALQ